MAQHGFIEKLGIVVPQSAASMRGMLLTHDLEQLQ